jgi:hypothetical protein
MKMIYTGLYKEKLMKGYEDYKFIFQNSVKNPDYFLNGWCEIFSKEIYKKYGWQIETMLLFFNISDEYTDEEILSMDHDIYVDNIGDFDRYDVSLIHCYNTFYINGTKYFVDVRGITNDYTEFLKPFERYRDGEYVKVIQYTIAELETKFWSCENGNVAFNYFKYDDAEKDIRYFTRLAKKYIKDNKGIFILK